MVGACLLLGRAMGVGLKGRGGGVVLCKLKVGWELIGLIGWMVSFG